MKECYIIRAEKTYSFFIKGMSTVIVDIYTIHKYNKTLQSYNAEEHTFKYI